MSWLSNYLYEPNLLVPGRRPVGGLKININHPYAHNLIAAFDGMSARNAVTKRTGAVEGQAKVRTPRGFEFDSDNSADYIEFDADLRSETAFGQDEFFIFALAIWPGGGIYPVFVANGDTGPGEWMLRLVDQRINFFGNGGSILLSSSASVTQGQPFTVAMARVLEGELYRGHLFLDGVADGVDTSAGGNLTAVSATAGIGQADLNANSWLNGSIALVYIWRGSLPVADYILAKKLNADPYQLWEPVPDAPFLPSEAIPPATGEDNAILMASNF